MRRAYGFTLVEALLGVGLAALLIGLGTPRTLGLVRSVRLAGAARWLAADLRRTRGRAIAESTALEVRFDAARGAYEVRVRGAAAGEARTLPVGIALADLPARGRLVFTPLGTAENGTVTLAAGGHARRVVVNQRGRVRVE
jgi:Tfp pilus assembly protein FimT